MTADTYFEDNVRRNSDPMRQLLNRFSTFFYSENVVKHNATGLIKVQHTNEVEMIK